MLNEGWQTQLWQQLVDGLGGDGWLVGPEVNSPPTCRPGIGGRIPRLEIKNRRFYKYPTICPLPLAPQ